VERETLANVQRQVTRQFPEMSGVAPKVKRQDEGYLVTFRGRVALPGGGSMARIVHAVVDERGRIVRLSTSK
jgi:hypothetical protein